MSDINADNNGAYLKSRNTNKVHCCDDDRTSIVREGAYYSSSQSSELQDTRQVH